MLMTLPTARCATLVKSGSAAATETAGRACAAAGAAAAGACSAAADSSAVRKRPVSTMPIRNPMVMNNVVRLMRLVISAHLDPADGRLGQLGQRDRESSV